MAVLAADLHVTHMAGAEKIPALCAAADTFYKGALIHTQIFLIDWRKI